MAGLDPAIHGAACSMDARIKSGHDSVSDPSVRTTAAASNAPRPTEPDGLVLTDRSRPSSLSGEEAGMPWEKQFDSDAVLDKAMQAFWARGYEATSMQDLVDCMGINRGSLYATFGDKHSLFIQALRRYDGPPPRGLGRGSGGGQVAQGLDPGRLRRCHRSGTRRGLSRRLPAGQHGAGALAPRRRDLEDRGPRPGRDGGLLPRADRSRPANRRDSRRGSMPWRPGGPCWASSSACACSRAAARRPRCSARCATRRRR